MDRAIDRGLTFQSSRTTPDELAPMAAEFFDRGGTTLAHRIRVDYGEHVEDGEVVDWNTVSGSVDRLVDALSRYREMGVSDLSLIPGLDDASSLRTVEVLASEVVPQLVNG